MKIDIVLWPPGNSSERRRVEPIVPSSNFFSTTLVMRRGFQ
jgi:hypothetical protein